MGYSTKLEEKAKKLGIKITESVSITFPSVTCRKVPLADLQLKLDEIKEKYKDHNPDIFIEPKCGNKDFYTHSPYLRIGVYWTKTSEELETEIEDRETRLLDKKNKKLEEEKTKKLAALKRAEEVYFKLKKELGE